MLLLLCCAVGTQLPLAPIGQIGAEAADVVLRALCGQHTTKGIVLLMKASAQ